VQIRWSLCEESVKPGQPRVIQIGRHGVLFAQAGSGCCAWGGGSCKATRAYEGAGGHEGASEKS